MLGSSAASDQDAAAVSDYGRSHLEQLESEAIHIVREVAAQFDRPVLLFSGGKDSVTLAHVAKKAFPARASSLPAAPRRYRPQLPRDADSIETASSKKVSSS